MKNDKGFILTVLLIAIAIKLIIMLAYFYFWLLPGNPDLIGPDGEAFSQKAWYISKVLRDKVDYQVPSNEFAFQNFHKLVNQHKGQLPLQDRANFLFTYFIGFTYFLFGYVPLLMKGFNIFISAVSSILFYLLALEIYSRSVARISFILFTFFPSIFIFSITLLRDPLIILCILAILYALIKLNKALNFKDLALLIVALILILFLRQELFVIMAVLALVVFLLSKKLKYKIVIFSIMAASLLFVTNSSIFYKITLRPAVLIKNVAPIIFSKNAGLYATGGRLVYKVFPEKYYSTYKKYATREEYFNSDEKITIIEFIKCLPKGILSYLTRPFPFIRKGFIDNLMSLQMIYWYTILILSIFGIFRTRFASVYPVLIYIAMMLIITSMVDANEGILLRHRDSIVPFFIIFASSGIDKINRAARKGLILEQP